MFENHIIIIELKSTSDTESTMSFGKVSRKPDVKKFRKNGKNSVWRAKCEETKARDTNPYKVERTVSVENIDMDYCNYLTEPYDSLDVSPCDDEELMAKLIHAHDKHDVYREELYKIYRKKGDEACLLFAQQHYDVNPEFVSQAYAPEEYSSKGGKRNGSTMRRVPKRKMKLEHVCGKQCRTCKKRVRQLKNTKKVFE